MIFEFKNLGSIKKASVEMGNLTVICGKNNTGKTYLTYGVWGMLYNTHKLIYVMKNADFYQAINKAEIEQKLNETGKAEIKDIRVLADNIRDFILNGIKERSRMLDKIFSSHRNFFANTEINVKKESIIFDFSKPLSGTIETSEWAFSYKKEGNTLHLQLKKEKSSTFNDLEEMFQFIFSPHTRQSLFLLTAQRDSIELFYKELDSNRSNLINKLRGNRDLNFLEQNTARFPMPIQENIDFARDLATQVIKTDSFLKSKHPDLLLEIEKMLGVEFLVINGAVFIKVSGSEKVIPIFMASTSVRALLHLHFWLKHKAQKGDLLMIDEPELNLHPENQIKMARLFAKLVNVGIRVWITTHSDYIVKELNNCLMLSNEFEGKQEMMEELGYENNEILKKEDVKAYITQYGKNLSACTVVPVKFDNYGLVMTTFDEQIEKINHISNELANAIDISKLKTQKHHAN